MTVPRINSAMIQPTDQISTEISNHNIMFVSMLHINHNKDSFETEVSVTAPPKIFGTNFQK